MRAGSAGHGPCPPVTNRPSPPAGNGRAAWLLAGGVAALAGAWIVASLAVRPAHIVVSAPRAQTGVEAASALARLFGALVLALFPDERARFRWVAGGLGILGLGGLVFGSLQPLLDDEPDLNASMYASLVVWSMAGALFAAGLAPAATPPFSRRAILLTLAAFGALSGALLLGAGRLLPPLVQVSALEAAAAGGDVPLPGLTGWHWLLSLVPFALALVAVAGAARHLAGAPLGGWLLVAMVLLAGAQAHNLFWPSAYSPLVTAANLLRLAFAIVIAVGGVLELRRIAADRARQLAAEQAHARDLVELAAARRDFVAMIAHELGSPLAAIQASADVLATGGLPPEEQARVVAGIRAEANLLATLVADAYAGVAGETGDFAVQPRPVTLGVLLAAAEEFAAALSGDHPVTFATTAAAARVRADPERMLQVLCNLLANAARYSPPGAPIEVRAARRGGRVRIEVVDRGFGIAPDDLPRIFEKFGRGRAAPGRDSAGLGLGLYVARRIVRAHGADLTVESTPGAGSTFAFELETVS